MTGRVETDRPSPRAGRSELDRLRALLDAALRTDFFGASGAGAGSTLASTVLFQAAVAVMAGGVLYLALSPFALLVAGLTLVAILSALALGPEAADILRGDESRTAGLPVGRATMRAARALHAATYLILGTAGAAIPIAVFAGAAASSVAVGIAAFGAAMHQSAFLAAIAGGLDALLARSRVGDRLRSFLSLAIGAALVAALLLGIRPLPEVESSIAAARPWLAAFPPAWFAAEALALGGALPFAAGDLLGAAAGGSIAAALLALLATRPTRRETAVVRRPGALRRAASRLWVRPDERATFDLVLDVVPRERDRALRAGPIFAFPAALLLAAAALRDPEERRLLVHVLLFVSSAYLPAAVLLLARAPREGAGARWLFVTSPVTDPAALRAGVRKAAALSVVLPLVAALEAADVAIRGPLVAMRHAPVVLAVALLVLHRSTRGLPQPYPLGEARGRLLGGAGEGALGLAFVLTLFGFAEERIVRDAWSSVVAGAVMLGLVAIVDRRRRREPPLSAETGHA
ncbi:MAG TPA: hypothetical protein VKE69_09200 [Planctomycetota bacterium]|nr:hypothetical protein [Planctomycetota bacterium]